MACAEFTKQNPAIGYAYSRQINSLIHEDIPYPGEASGIFDPNIRLAIEYPAFLEHQKTILEAVKGCEKAIFNDPNPAYYIGKPHIQGKEGHMSTLMTNGFLYLYNELLKVPGLEVNADVDLRILLNLVQSIPVDGDTFRLPSEELEIIRSIVQTLYPKRKTDIFTPQWYSSYVSTMEKLDELFLNKFTHYITSIQGNPYKRAIEDPGQALIDDTSLSQEDQQLLKMANQQGYMPMYGDEYRLYEIHPPYTSLSNLFGQHTTDELIQKYIPMLKTIFPPVARGGKRSKRQTRHTKRKQRKTRRKH